MPDNSMLVVNFAALTQASADIQSAVNTMRQTIDDLEQSAAPMVSTWEGDARQAYDQRQNTWRQAANDLNQILTEVKRALEESAQEYSRTEKTNAALFGG